MDKIDIDKIRKELHPGNKIVEALALHNTVKINELVFGYNEINRVINKRSSLQCKVDNDLMNKYNEIKEIIKHHNKLVGGYNRLIKKVNEMKERLDEYTEIK